MADPDGLRDRLRLTVVTDPDCGRGRTVSEVVAAALQAGAGCIQLRAKGASAREMVALGRELRRLSARASALLIVNDRLDVALCIGADGVHVGDDDLPVEGIRATVPSGFIVGRSADSEDLAREAERAGADYLGVGPVFPTASKSDAGAAAGTGLITRMSRATSLPVVGIGGIEPQTAGAVVEAGAAGVAVISAVMRADDPAEATGRFLGAASAALVSRS